MGNMLRYKIDRGRKLINVDSSSTKVQLSVKIVLSLITHKLSLIYNFSM